LCELVYKCILLFDDDEKSERVIIVDHLKPVPVNVFKFDGKGDIN